MTVRAATPLDAPAISALMLQLGYEAPPELVLGKLHTLAGREHDTVLVAQDPHGRLEGVISLHVLELFHAPGRLGRITSLVVEDAARGRGVGALLVDRADAWFRDQGCVRAEVTSGDHRPGAHAFYEARGYQPDERRFVRRY